ncbi:MAG: hypothetical protein M1816_005424 [Peltula sp. TS41687]|nr:MAG: hypothetical protein M1816_005424 [Peltula sp. TS41687]
MSPFEYQSNPLLYPTSSLYPTEESHEAYVLQQSSPHGLGIMDYSVPYGPNTVTTAPPTPPNSAMIWSDPPSSGRLQPPTSRGYQTVSSAAYEPFPAFQTPSPSVPMEHTFSLTPSCGPELSPSPEASCNISTRSSFSSCAPSEGFLQINEEQNVPSSVKPERSPDWFVRQVGSMDVPGRSVQEPTTSRLGGISLTNPFGGVGPYSEVMRSVDSHSGSGYDEKPDQRKFSEVSSIYEPQHETRSRVSSVSSRSQRTTRKRRQLTTAAEASHTCEICGKLFGRSYNYKAHLETHDPGRVYAHPCLEENCDKKFVRKTDLTRHHQSVHQKRRDFRCELCGHLFARKDTLRRHTEDGCTRRFDITSQIIQTTESPHGEGAQTIAIDVSAGGRVLVRTRRSSGEGAMHPSVSSAGPTSSSMGTCW